MICSLKHQRKKRDTTLFFFGEQSAHDPVGLNTTNVNGLFSLVEAKNLALSALLIKQDSWQLTQDLFIIWC